MSTVGFEPTISTGVRPLGPSVLRYAFLILGTNHPANLHLREEGCEDPWLFIEAKMGPRTEHFGKHCTRGIILHDGHKKQVGEHRFSVIAASDKATPHVQLSV
jgi:hypothetical protein